MANNDVLHKLEDTEDELEFSDMTESYFDEETMAAVMGGLIEASNNQMKLALELTKLAVEKRTTEMKEDEVFAIYQKAADVIADSFPLSDLMEKLQLNG